MPRTAVVLVALTVAGQVAALLDGDLRGVVMLLSLLVLDGFGAVYSVRAARRGAYRMSWRLAAAGRAFSLSATLAFTAHEVTAGRAWWWIGVAAGLIMFACLTAAALATSAQRLDRGLRRAFVAEVVTVFSSGFLVVWYFVLDPVLSRGDDGPGLIFEAGYPIGNLLLLAAVSAVLMRGPVTRLTGPSMLLLTGILLYAAADTIFSAIRINGAQTSGSAVSNAALLLASLVMTVAAVRQAAAPAPADNGTGRVPAWSAHVPFVAVGAGNLLLVAVTIHEKVFLHWGALTIAQAVTTSALALRQWFWLQDSRRLNVTDRLTGLANVTGLQRSLQSLKDERAALMLLDLDGFKQVNDTLGHDAGDRVLVEFARQVRQSVRRGDVAARVGGDEFVVLLRDIDTDAQATAVAERILTALRTSPLEIDGQQVIIRCSIGLATKEPGDTARELQHRADIAMYESKRSGSHGWLRYDPAMADRRTRDAALADALATAAGSAELKLAYQPLVDLATGQPVGVEALLRWEHPVLGAVPPAEFVPIAERTGLIAELGLWALEEACRQVQQWRATTPLYASVNVSAQQLERPDFPEQVRAVLDRTGLPPGALVLEITESAIVDAAVAGPACEALRAYGIRVAVDDFGTGYSSLHLLSDLPVDILKIDRSFVAKLDGTTRGAGVAEAVIRLAGVLGLTTVAEGIETAAQVAELQMLGCSTAQGYLFARPGPAEDFSLALSARTPSPRATGGPPAPRP
ncbi:putative bifunctional diguanylate cyclase/phosphodiesterase [Symbioplanes lichenis]|uniref:putative bifunctional diguanylate cyclase/phosphodiesterase n=1 Tax=Symbioplanes lichenis TaxID=1629072 RepID=UPI002738DBF1|nr:bifunctional diguanylate cyclase/phosphodiesterase [Actinoplanes lichenis]